VTHANHPNELGAAQGEVLTALKQSGVTLLNQSVLLRGVNDNIDALRRLSEVLFSHGVLPYYLHQLDRVSGAAHFEVSDKQARTLHQALQNSLPGYLVPRLVRERAGEKSKLPL
jgi:L-lysine 2,3-aminomutase